eukprot:11179060-Lingulodinium_polyedra.AAC.1
MDPAPPRDVPHGRERQHRRDKRFQDKVATPCSTPPTRPSKEERMTPPPTATIHQEISTPQGHAALVADRELPSMIEET